MAVAIHGSTPAIVGTEGAVSVTTGSFSPPADSLLVACIGRYASNTVTMSNSGTSLTWTLQADESLSRVYTAPNASAQSNITVTFNNTSNTRLHLKVYVITGHNIASPVGATGTDGESNLNVTANAYTSTVSGSLGLCSAAYPATVTALSSTDDEDSYDGSSYGGMGIAKASTTPTPGTTVTFNMQNASGFNPSWRWAAVEIVPPAPDPGRRVHVTPPAPQRAASW